MLGKVPDATLAQRLGEHGLQQMLMQTDGRKIMLLPAWPKGWDAEFKLHAPFQTTIQGRVENGKLLDLVVTPEPKRPGLFELQKSIRLSGHLPKARVDVRSGQDLQGRYHRLQASDLPDGLRRSLLWDDREWLWRHA